MLDKAWTNTVIIAGARLLTGCAKTPDYEQGSSNPFVPTKAQLEKMRDKAPLQTARAASKLEFGCTTRSCKPMAWKRRWAARTSTPSHCTTAHGR